jgi:hypothetical protein
LNLYNVLFKFIYKPIAIANPLTQFSKGIAQVKIERYSCNEVKPMTVRQRRYSKEEIARRGQELYESGIRQQVEAGNDGKIVAIDIETGEFEVDETVMGATDRLFERQPDAQPFGIRIGHRAVYHFGSRSLKKNQ